MVSEEQSRKIDLACLILFPLGLVIVFFLTIGGYNVGKDPEYIAVTQLVSAVVTMILPIMRLKNLFKAPYWFLILMTTNVYMYSVMLFCGFYDNIWWWDKFSHWYSSLLVSMVVFIALAVVEHSTKCISLLPKPVFLLLVFMIGFSFGNIWEIAEGLVDAFSPKAYMQGPIIDTMGDLRMDFLGAGVMVLIGALLTRKRGMGDIVAKSGIEEKMAVIGKKWDRRCGCEEEKEE